MNEGQLELDKIARISEAVEESYKVIRSSLNFLIQHYRVKRLINGEQSEPRSLNHLQEKLSFLQEIGYINQDQVDRVSEFFARYEAINVELQRHETGKEFKDIKVDDPNDKVSSLDHSITLYFKDYTELALLLVRLKVNAF